MENDRIKILWGVSIQCDHIIEARRLEIVIIDKEDKNFFVVVPIPRSCCPSKLDPRNSINDPPFSKISRIEARVEFRDVR